MKNGGPCSCRTSPNNKSTIIVNKRIICNKVTLKINCFYDGHWMTG